MSITKTQKEKKLEQILGKKTKQINGLDGLKIDAEIVDALSIFSSNKEHLTSLIEAALNEFGIKVLAAEYLKIKR